MFLLDRLRATESYGELWKAIESYEELRRALGKMFILYLNITTQEIWRATDSYGQTCTNTRNTSIPPWGFKLLSCFCRQIQPDGRHTSVVVMASKLGAGFNIL